MYESNKKNKKNPCNNTATTKQEAITPLGNNQLILLFFAFFGFY